MHVRNLSNLFRIAPSPSSGWVLIVIKSPLDQRSRATNRSSLPQSSRRTWVSDLFRMKLRSHELRWPNTLSLCWITSAPFGRQRPTRPWFNPLQSRYSGYCSTTIARDFANTSSAFAPLLWPVAVAVATSASATAAARTPARARRWSTPPGCAGSAA